MKKIQALLSFLLVASILTSCSNDRLDETDTSFPDESLEQSSNDLPRDFTLKAGETVLVNGVDFQFERVEQDSRCPKGTQCITAGLAKVIVSYTVDNDPKQEILSFGANSSDKATVKIDGMALTLASLKPYPASNIRIDPTGYQAHFIAYQAGSADSPLEKAVVIDVRTQEEYDAGHIKSATLIPYDQISQKIGELDLNKDQTIVVYCRSGNRAGKAKDTLQSMGYDNVINTVDQNVTQYLFNSGE